MLRQLSPQLQDQVRLAVVDNTFAHLRAMGRSPSLSWGKGFRVEIARCLKGEVFPPEEIIRGDSLRDRRYSVADRVCFLVKGTCALLRRGDDEELALVANLHQGASWGELEVFCGREWPEDHVIRAQQHSDVYHLVGDKFREIYEEFTVEHEALRRVLRGRTQDYITSEECAGLTSQVLQEGEQILEQAEEEDVIQLTASYEDIGDHGALPREGISAMEQVGGDIAMTPASAEEVRDPEQIENGSASQGGSGNGSGTGVGGTRSRSRGDDVEALMGEIIATQRKLLGLKDSLVTLAEKKRLAEPGTEVAG